MGMDLGIEIDTHKINDCHPALDAGSIALAAQGLTTSSNRSRPPDWIATMACSRTLGLAW
jgi:hypothetical protein